MPALALLDLSRFNSGSLSHLGGLRSVIAILQSPNGQVTLHTIADSPPNDAPGMQLHHNRQIQPAFACLDVRDINGPFLVLTVSDEVAIQQIGRNVIVMAAVGRSFILAGSDGLYAVVTH